jgi:hypothetical protein
MSIFDIDSKPITKKFLKSKGFIRCQKSFRHKTLPGVIIYTCNYPVNHRNSQAQPNTARILYYNAWHRFEYVHFNNIYTERDVEFVLSVWETKYKNKC